MPIRNHKKQEPLTVDEAVVALERFCAYQDRYLREIQLKLREYQIEPRDADVIIQYLREENFFSDVRYADAYVRGKVRHNHWGMTKVRLHLLSKGIAEHTVEEAVANFPREEYLQMMRSVAERKLIDLHGATDIQKRLKLSQYLIRAGFERELAISCAQDLCDSGSTNQRL